MVLKLEYKPLKSRRNGLFSLADEGRNFKCVVTCKIFENMLRVCQLMLHGVYMLQESFLYKHFCQYLTSGRAIHSNAEHAT